MSLTVSCGFLLSLTGSPSAMELYHVSHYLPWVMADSHRLSDAMELLHVSHCLSGPMD